MPLPSYGTGENSRYPRALKTGDRLEALERGDSVYSNDHVAVVTLLHDLHRCGPRVTDHDRAVGQIWEYHTEACDDALRTFGSD